MTKNVVFIMSFPILLLAAIIAHTLIHWGFTKGVVFIIERRVPSIPTNVAETLVLHLLENGSIPDNNIDSNQLDNKVIVNYTDVSDKIRKSLPLLQSFLVAYHGWSGLAYTFFLGMGLYYCAILIEDGNKWEKRKIKAAMLSLKDKNPGMMILETSEEEDGG